MTEVRPKILCYSRKGPEPQISDLWHKFFRTGIISNRLRDIPLKTSQTYAEYRRGICTYRFGPWQGQLHGRIGRGLPDSDTHVLFPRCFGLMPTSCWDLFFACFPRVEEVLLGGDRQKGVQFFHTDAETGRHGGTYIGVPILSPQKSSR